MYLTALTYQNLMADAKGPKQDMRHDESSNLHMQLRGFKKEGLL